MICNLTTLENKSNTEISLHNKHHKMKDHPAFKILYACTYF